MIHKTSIIDKNAKISQTAKIGPYTIIGSNVEIGDEVEIHSHVNIAGNTKVGKGTKIFPFASVGSEIAMMVQEEAFDYLDAPSKKVNCADVPMPYSSVLEKLYLPQVEDIVMAIEEVCYI